METLLDIKEALEVKLFKGDISATPEDAKWLLAMIDAAYLYGRSAERCEVNQTIQRIMLGA